MSNLQTGAVRVQALGKLYTLQFTINALCILEAELGANDTMDIQKMIGDRPSITALRTLFWAGLQEHQPQSTKEEAGRVIDAVGLVQATEAMTTALMAAMGTMAPGGAAAPLAPAAGIPVAATG